MSKIIRCILPDKVERFEPFTVKDYRDLLLLRNDLDKNSIDAQEEMINEILNIYFPDQPVNYQYYIFCVVFLSSIGKTKLPLVAECPKCGSPVSFMANFEHKGLYHPNIQLGNGLSIKIKFPETPVIDVPEYIVDNILSVKDSENEYSFNNLSEEERNLVIDGIGKNELAEIMYKILPLNYNISYYHCDKKYEFKVNDFLTFFKMIIHPDEIFPFYQINHRLIRFHYDLNSIMNMLPLERNVALSLIEKDLTEK